MKRFGSDHVWGGRVMSAMNGVVMRPAASSSGQMVDDIGSDLTTRKRAALARLELVLRAIARPIVRRLPSRVQILLARLYTARRTHLLLKYLPFDDDVYLRLNPDVAETVRQGRFRSGLDHFVSYGIDELETSPNRVLRIPLHGYQFDFDPSAYRIDNPDAAILIAQGRYRSSIDHFLRVGHDQCLEGTRSLYAADRFIRCLAAEDGHAALTEDRRYLALFAHYDRDGIVDDYVVAYLNALRKAGADICFITTVALPSELDKIRGLTFRIIRKTDAGRDFGSWYLGLQYIEAEFRAEYDYLLFVNDSVYFPVVRCDELFSRMTARKFDLWGITDCRYHNCYHLQSYFLAFGRKAQEVLLPWFTQTVESIRYMTKFGQIATFEFGLPERALDKGLTVGAYCSIDDIREDVVREQKLAHWRPTLQLGLDGVNPTHHIWDLLIRRYNCPALKIELIRDNPLRVDIRDWKSVIDPQVADRSTFARHIKRMRKAPLNRLPSPSITVGNQQSQVALLNTVECRGFGSGRRLVLLAHYDPDGMIDPHVESSVRALAAQSCDVALVTSSTRSRDIERMRAICASIFIKNDHGRDFGSWFIASEALKSKYHAYETIIWMNDSTYFPLFDLTEMFGKMERKNYDFWGVVDSNNLRWHIMSWFWAFRRELLDSGWPSQYIAQYEPAYSKWDQIKNYEMRLPAALKKAGRRTGAYVSADELFNYVRRYESDHERFSGRSDFTMTHDYWDVIIRRFRCPALKVELLRDNPLGLELKDILGFVSRHTSYNPDLIRNHLKRIKATQISSMLNCMPTNVVLSESRSQHVRSNRHPSTRVSDNALSASETLKNAQSN